MVRCHPDEFVADSGYCPMCTSRPVVAYARHSAPQPDLWVLRWDVALGCCTCM